MAESMRIDRHQSPRNTSDRKEDERHAAHVHDGVHGHVTHLARRVVTVGDRCPAVCKFMQHDGEDHPERPAKEQDDAAAFICRVDPPIHGR